MEFLELIERTEAAQDVSQDEVVRLLAEIQKRIKQGLYLTVAECNEKTTLCCVEAVDVVEEPRREFRVMVTWMHGAKNGEEEIIPVMSFLGKCTFDNERPRFWPLLQ